MTDYTYTPYIPEDNETDYPTKITDFMNILGTQMTDESDKTDGKAALVTPGEGGTDVDEVLIKSTAAGEITTSGAKIGTVGAGSIVTVDAEQTLTTKTLTSPIINTPDIDVIDDAHIGVSIPSTGKFSTLESASIIGTATLTEDVVLGTTDTDTITINGETSGNIVPNSAVSTDTLGSVTNPYSDLHLSGFANISTGLIMPGGNTVNFIASSMESPGFNNTLLTEKAIFDHVESATASATGRLVDVKIYDTFSPGSTQWVKPTGTTAVEVWVIGGGGGGGKAWNSNTGTPQAAGAGGGGSGAYAYAYFESTGVDLMPASVDVAVGGGAAGGESGQLAGQSWFGSTSQEPQVLCGGGRTGSNAMSTDADINLEFVMNDGGLGGTVISINSATVQHEILGEYGHPSTWTANDIGAGTSWLGGTPGKGGDTPLGKGGHCRVGLHSHVTLSPVLEDPKGPGAGGCAGWRGAVTGTLDLLENVGTDGNDGIVIVKAYV